jgi:hypothetical protein
MDLARYAVNAVLVEGRSAREVAAATGRSKSWVHRHVVLFRAGGAAALAPAKRGPKTAPNQTPPAVEDAIVLPNTSGSSVMLRLDHRLPIPSTV